MEGHYQLARADMIQPRSIHHQSVSLFAKEMKSSQTQMCYSDRPQLSRMWMNVVESDVQIPNHPQ